MCHLGMLVEAHTLVLWLRITQCCSCLVGQLHSDASLRWSVPFERSRTDRGGDGLRGASAIAPESRSRGDLF